MGFILSTVQYKNLLEVAPNYFDAASLELESLGRFLAPKFVLSAVCYSVEPEFIQSNSFPNSFGPFPVFPYSE